MGGLDGKVGLVTGASRGIGRAIAWALARSGADVAVNYRVRSDEARKTVDLVALAGRKALPVQADVTRASEIARMVSEVERELGPIGVLVNNAGIARNQEIDEVTESDWGDVIAANLTSVFLVTQAVLPGMRSRGWGRIVNISSGAAQTGGLVGVHYTAAKAGVEGLTKAYASRLVKEGITVNAVAPALIETDMISDTAALRNRIPVGRLGRPDEIAQAVVFLATTAYSTGQTVHLNGGLYYR